jgi:hypothetical protein
MKTNTGKVQECEDLNPSKVAVTRILKTVRNRRSKKKFGNHSFVDPFDDGYYK